jgi:hypothetical protein
MGALMDRTVWKATLQMREIQQIAVPAGAHLLCAREQGNDICVWFLCDPAAPHESRTIAIVGTGYSAPSENEARYLGTASFRDGQFMFHVFERQQ